MSVEGLLNHRKATQVFLFLVRAGARTDRIAGACHLSKDETGRLLIRMQRAGLLAQKSGSWGVDWNRFLPLFLHHAMRIYAAAMPWKFVPYYMEKPEADVVEAACARAERELARAKVKLANNDLFAGIVRDYLTTVALEVSAPQEYLEDLRVADAISEFEYALLKLVPKMRRSSAHPERKELLRLLRTWYDHIQAYDTPVGAALRAVFQKQGLL